MGDRRGRNQNIGLANHGRQIAGARVADGHGRVFADQQQRSGHPDNVRAAQNDGVGALDFDANLFEQVNTAKGRTGHKKRLTAFLGQPADIQWRETVHIFFEINQRQNALLIDLGGHRQLDENPAHAGVGV